MAYTIHITDNAEEAAAKYSEVSLSQLANDLNLESADLSAAFGAYLAALPTEDPLEDDAFWLEAGVVTISAGAE